MELFTVDQKGEMAKKVADPVFWMTNPQGQEIYLGLVTTPLPLPIAKAIEEKQGRASSVVIVACDKDGNILKEGKLINFSPMGVAILCTNVTKEVPGLRGEFEEMAVLPGPLAMLALVSALFEALGKGPE